MKFLFSLFLTVSFGTHAQPLLVELGGEQRFMNFESVEEYSNSRLASQSLQIPLQSGVILQMKNCVVVDEKADAVCELVSGHENERLGSFNFAILERNDKNFVYVLPRAVEIKNGMAFLSKSTDFYRVVVVKK